MRRASRLGCLALLFSISIAAHGAVGRTPGAAAVSPSGAATYSIPLHLPPGTRGLTPQLGLVYSSNVGLSIAGVGWSITGVTQIARCASTVAQDGVARDVRNDLQDRFCLNGNRLRLAAGTYGVAGSEYRTEIDTFTRVTAYGAAGNGPAYFVAYGQDGLIYEYGNSADSRIESIGQATARAWALNRIRDRQGNAIDFAYTEDATNGGYRLELVSYAGNSALGITAPYTVDFVYESKPAAEIDSSYIAGSRVQQITRLDRVDVLHNGSTLVRRYELTYEPALSSTGRSRLASVQECAGTTSDCLSPTQFTYYDGVPFGAEVSSGAGVSSGAVWPLDINGDGREDLVYSSSATSGAGQWMVMFANASGGYDTPVNTGITNTNFGGAIPIDYNRDGRADLLVPYSGSTWWVLLGTASGLATPVNTLAPVTSTGKGDNAHAIDINGDGLEDLVWADLIGYAGGDAIRYRLRVAGGAFSTTVTTLVGPLAVKTKLTGGMFTGWAQRMATRAPDINGDGRADVIYQVTQFIPGTPSLPGEPGDPDEYYYSTVAVCPGSGTYFVSNDLAASWIFFGDFNGDGKSDIFYRSGVNQWRYRFSTGTGFGPELSAGSWLGYGVGSLILDWDGDGKSDVLVPHTASNSWYVLRSTGEALAAPAGTGLALPAGSGGIPTVTDINGDAQADLAYIDSASVWRFRTRTVSHTYPDLLASATDGFGTTAAFTYAPISNSSIYTRGTGTVYPQTDVNDPIWVVSQMSQSDGSGTGSNYDTNFTYEGARKDLQGRGFLGFAKRTAVDTRMGYNQRTIETWKQDFPYIGALASVERQQSGGTRIALASNTWSSLSFGTGFDARRYPYVSASTTDQHEVGGLSNGVKIRTVAMTVAGAGGVDSTSGLIKDATTTTTEVATGLFGGSTRSERIQHTAVLNDTTNWCLGRPTATQVTRSHTLASGAAVTRSSDTNWDAVNCRPTQSRLEPGHATLQVTVALGYDSFGNVNSQTVTGAGMAGRTTTIDWGALGQFPLSMTNPLSQTSSQSWNAALGVPSSVTDPNGLAVSWSYDAFGRRTLETRPDGTSTQWSYSTCSGSCDARIKQQVVQEERDSTTATFRTSTDYLDRWDRSIWQKVQQLTVNDTTWTVRREFDAAGRLSKNYVPYQTGGSDNGYTLLGYDAVNRVTAESLYRAGGVPDRTTGYAYSGYVVTRTDPLGHATTRTTSAWGDLVRVADAANGQTNYQWDAFGLLKQATDAANNVVSQASYNVRGMRTQLADVDLGTWSYTPNALGEVVSQSDAKSQVTTFTFDALGRPSTRTEAEGTSIWTWGASSASRNIGRLQSMTGPGYGESYTYDSLGRPATRSITSDATYQFDYAYNTLGQLDALTYPTSTAGVRFKAKFGYTGGYLSSVQDYTGNFNGPVLWNLNLMDARFNAVSETYGNGLWLQNAFDPLTGVPTTRKSGTGGLDSNVQNLSYAWDTAGNLTSRTDLRQSLTESFSYDALDRLTQASGPGTQLLTLAFDAIGNITSKSGVGSYTYSPTKKHAVTSAGGTAYTYDANGNLITRGGAAVGWTSYNLPSSIGDPSGYSSQFSYAPDRSRWRQVSTYTGATETTIYVGGLLEKLTAQSTTYWKHIIPTASGQVQVVRRSDGSNETLYIATDHLGSTDVVMNAAGTIVARESFAAYGTRRSSSWQGSPSPAEWQSIADNTRRGYTGHEHLDSIMLIHMNGRAYDPVIGRFLSADPYVDGADTTQGWNRYSYVQNGPLGAFDPSGYAGTSADDRRLVRCISCYVPAIAGAFGYWSQEGTLGVDSNGTETLVTQLVWHGSSAHTASTPASVNSNGGGAGGNGQGGGSKGAQANQIENWLCRAGNSLQSASKKAAALGTRLEAGGIVLAGLGFLAVGPGGAVPGGAMAAFGGAITLGGAGIQVVGGTLQLFSGPTAGSQNVAAGAISILTAGVTSATANSFMRSGGNYVVRAYNQRVDTGLAIGGAVVDELHDLSGFFEPQEASCD